MLQFIYVARLARLRHRPGYDSRRDWSGDASRPGGRSKRTFLCGHPFSPHLPGSHFKPRSKRPSDPAGYSLTTFDHASTRAAIPCRQSEDEPRPSNFRTVERIIFIVPLWVHRLIMCVPSTTVVSEDKELVYCMLSLHR